MNLTSEKLEQIKNYGELKYLPDRICKLLGLFGEQAQAFMDEFQDEESPARQHYEQGFANGDFDVDVKLQSKSTEGDILSIQELNTRQYRTKINSLKKELFGI